MINQTQNNIRFVLDNQIVEIDFKQQGNLKPTTTVLNYLRGLPDHKGVKEGCGEGDCGACTVVLASVDKKGKLHYHTFDSCLVFLPMIHGKQLIAVENLAQRENNETILHPVQQAVADLNGTQCGYCTPGIVMSLFGIYKNHENPADKVILDALSGNLCRCTGYQSILEAARSLNQNSPSDHFSENEGNVAGMLMQINADNRTIEIHAGNQIYLKPFTIDEALRIRKESPLAILIAGSTDVSLRQTKKREQLPIILDISGIEDLRLLEEKPDCWELGAGLSLETVRTWSMDKIPALYNILGVFGSLQIRNIATLGGNVGSASPIGDTLPLLLALKASIRCKSSTDDRITPIEQFIVGYRKTSLHSDELITTIIIPKPAAGTILWTHKVSKRKDLDISTVSAAFSLTVESGIVSEIFLAYGGMAEKPVRARETEQFLHGKLWNRKNIEKAMDILEMEFNPISDARAGAAFRRVAAKNLLMKFFIHDF